MEGGWIQVDSSHFNEKLSLFIWDYSFSISSWFAIVLASVQRYGETCILEEIKYLGCRRCRTFAQEGRTEWARYGKGTPPSSEFGNNLKTLYLLHSPQLPPIFYSLQPPWPSTLTLHHEQSLKISSLIIFMHYCPGKKWQENWPKTDQIQNFAAIHIP